MQAVARKKNTRGVEKNTLHRQPQVCAMREYFGVPWPGPCHETSKTFEGSKGPRSQSARCGIARKNVPRNPGRSRASQARAEAARRLAPGRLLLAVAGWPRRSGPVHLA